MATQKTNPTASFAEPKGRLVSRLDHPVSVPYGTQALRLTPRGVTLPLVLRLLGELPAGVSAVPLS